MPKNNITPVQQELAWIYLPEAEAQRDSAAEVLLSEEHILPKYEATGQGPQDGKQNSRARRRHQAC
ncbi:hypothetical protein KEM48_005752 [Puccinia striiformis f. sp. tritici PST-130]|nr:hypothetical protein KEM48_005752 [Puccinia striiformis f. sp. tritici PST-130]